MCDVLILGGGLSLAVAGTMWLDARRSRLALALLHRWARRQDLVLLDVQRAWLWPGPFWWRKASIHIVLRIRLADADGAARTGWARIGGWWDVFGVSDVVEVKLDGDAPAGRRRSSPWSGCCSGLLWPPLMGGAHWLAVRRSREAAVILKGWASGRGIQLLEARRQWFYPGPFWLRRGRAVFWIRVVCSDGSRRVGWARVGRGYALFPISASFRSGGKARPIVRGRRSSRWSTTWCRWRRRRRSARRSR